MIFSRYILQLIKYGSGINALEFSYAETNELALILTYIYLYIFSGSCSNKPHVCDGKWVLNDHWNMRKKNDILLKFVCWMLNQDENNFYNDVLICVHWFYFCWLLSNVYFVLESWRSLLEKKKNNMMKGNRNKIKYEKKKCSTKSDDASSRQTQRGWK